MTLISIKNDEIICNSLKYKSDLKELPQNIKRANYLF